MASWLVALGIIIKILPFVVDMMKEAKKLFDGIPDSDDQKKEYVMAMVHTASIGMCEFTGDDMDKVVVMVEHAISSAVEFFYELMFKDKE